MPDEPSPRGEKRPRCSLCRALVAAATVATLAGPAAAHDTWLEARPAPPGRIELALTSGNLFPAGETAVAAASLVDRGCAGTSGRRVALEPGSLGPSALTLSAPASVDGAPVQSCWIQTEGFDLDLATNLVPVYLREIGASDSVQQIWAEQHRRGLPWHERYAKHARISFTFAPSAALRPPPMAIDIEIANTAPLHAGEVVEFRVLRDGRPLAGQAVELRGDLSRFGLWRRTDAEGRASVPVPLAGRWVLRATDLRPVPGQLGAWVSRFATHTFSVGEGPAAARGSPAQPNKPP